MEKDKIPPNLNPVSEQDFRSLLVSHRLVADKVIRDSYSAQINNSTGDTYIVDNCYFKNAFRLILVTCPAMEFHNCYINGLSISFSNCPLISFHNCSIGALEIISNDPKGTTITIKPTFPPRFLSKSLSEVGRLNCHGSGMINLFIDQTKIGNIYARENLNAFRLSMTKCTVESEESNSINIGGNDSRVLINDDCIINGGIESNNLVGGELTIIQSEIRKPLKLSEGKSLTIRILVSSLDSILLTSMIDLNLSIGGGTLNLLQAHLTRFSLFRLAQENGKDINVGTISLVNSKILSTGAVIDSCPMGTLELKYFDNESNITIKNSSISKSVIFEHCELGATQFQNVDFSENLKFVLLNSTITEAKFYTVDWMKDHKLYEEPGAERKPANKQIQYFLSLKESYRQLKAISISALNKFDALNFQRHEQRIQKEILKLKGGTWDYLLLLTNEKFNNYGLSYTLPFKWLIGIHFLWFSILILMGETFKYRFWSPGLPLDGGLTIKAVSDFLYTLFPLHDGDYLNGENGWPLIVDILMRLTSGYFIYYFVSATRKFHLN